MPVFVDDDLTIFVQEPKHQKKVKYISAQLTKWYARKARNPITKRWNNDDICVVKRNRIYYRGVVKEIYEKTILVNYISIRF